MVSSEYIEDVRSYEDLSKYMILSPKMKEGGEMFAEGSGDSFTGSGMESTEDTETNDMDNEFSEKSTGDGISSADDFIEINDDDEGK